MALNFPAKVYQILENESTDIIRWHENGMAFRIMDHGRFEREIIPKYFRHNQLSSVQRQLNLYGFKCISRGEDKGAFFHPNFKRGDWETVRKITRYVPEKKTFSCDNYPEKKLPFEDDYVFRDGSYQSASIRGDFNQQQMNHIHQQQGYNAGYHFNTLDSFSLFQPPPSADLDMKPGASTNVEWPHYGQVGGHGGHVEEKVKINPLYHGPISHPPQPPPPSAAPAARLDYKLPSVRQLTSQMPSSHTVGDRPFIIVTNNIVRIDPDYDLGYALNCTYDLDIGRHSINHFLQSQQQVQQQQQQSVSSIRPVTHPVHSVATSIPLFLPQQHPVTTHQQQQQQQQHPAGVPVTDTVDVNVVSEVVYNGRERSNSMDDFVFMCSEFA